MEQEQISPERNLATRLVEQAGRLLDMEPCQETHKLYGSILGPNHEIYLFQACFEDPDEPSSADMRSITLRRTPSSTNRVPSPQENSEHFEIDLTELAHVVDEPNLPIEAFAVRRSTPFQARVPIHGSFADEFERTKQTVDADHTGADAEGLHVYAAFCRVLDSIVTVGRVSLEDFQSLESAFAKAMTNAAVVTDKSHTFSLPEGNLHICKFDFSGSLEFIGQQANEPRLSAHFRQGEVLYSLEVPRHGEVTCSARHDWIGDDDDAPSPALSRLALEKIQYAFNRAEEWL